MRWFSACVLTLLGLALIGGCATTKTLTVSTKPADAILKVDRVPIGHGPQTLQFAFDDDRKTHAIIASREGFKDTPVTLKEDSLEFDRGSLTIELLPLTRKITINTNMPATISIDGKPVSDQMLSTYQTELPFSIINDKDEWKTYRVTAERPGFETDTQTVAYADLSPTYDLELKPHRKDINITSNLPGAKVFFDGKDLGPAPAKVPDVEFPYDPDKDEYATHQIRVEKPGYDAVKRTISWDNGDTDYDMNLVPRIKTVHIITEPPGATVLLNGVELPKESGVAIADKLPFKPDDKGQLKSYTVSVSYRTPQSEWFPQDFKLGWDDGKTEYQVTLKEVLTRNVDLETPVLERGANGWQIVPKTISTVAAKDLTEGSKEAPVQVTQFENGTMLDSLAVSPDGSRLVYALLQRATTAQDFRSKIELINTDGTGGRVSIDDGLSLDLMPSFTPGGDQIVYSSNRAGRKMNICAVSAKGDYGVTNLTTGDSNDLWPSVDSEPRQRLYYQAMLDSRPDERIYMTQINTIFKTDLPTGGEHPRVSPRNDSIIFTKRNEKTGLRDLWIMSDRGTDARNLTDTPGIDEFDPVWDRDGSRIAFASDRGVDQEGRHQIDIWVIDDLKHPENPKRITANASVDDCPAWDPTSNSIYFRSNRGGSWQIWKIGVH